MSEPENLVLQQLREIRATLDAHTETLSAHTQMLSAIQTRLSGIEQLVIMLVGLHKDSDARMARLEARVERLERARP